MASTSTSPAQTPETDSNSIARIFGALFSPTATFRSIVRKPTWLVPVLLITIVELGLIAVVSKRVGFRGILERQLQSNSRFQQLPPISSSGRLRHKSSTPRSGLLLSFPLAPH